MSGIVVRAPQFDESIAEMYSLGGKLCESPTFLVHGAVLPEHRENRLIVAGKSALEPLSEGTRRFGEQLSSLFSFFGMQKGRGTLFQGGIDSMGYPFLELDTVAGSQYSSAPRALPEAERRFHCLVEVVARFHDAGICFGDLSFASFLDEPARGPILVGLLGVSSPLTASTRQSAEECFLAPEVLSGALPTPAADVFSLCLMGGALCGVTVMGGERGDGAELYKKFIRQGVSEWLSRVLSVGAASDPTERPKSCVELIELMNEGRQGGLSGPLVKREDVPQETGEESPAKSGGAQVFDTPQVAPDIPEPSRASGRPVVILALLGILGFVFTFYFRGVTSNEDMGSANPSTAFLRSIGFSTSMTSAERQQLFKRLSTSEDPIVHDAAILLIEGAQTVEDRVEAENWLLERCAGRGLTNSVRIVRSWFGDKPLVRPRGYILALRVLDPSLPQEPRDTAFEEIGRINRTVAIQLGAGLLLDSGGREAERKSLSRLVKDELDEAEVLSRPLSAVLLALPESRNSLALDAPTIIKSLSPADTAWLISLMVKQGDYHLLSQLVAVLVETPGVTELQKSMLRTVVADDNAPIVVRGAVTRMTFGGITKDDIASVVNWNDKRAGTLLLNLSQLPLEDDDLTEIFKALVIKNVTTEPTAAMVAALAKVPEGERVTIGRAVGYFFRLSEEGKVSERPHEELVIAAAENPALLSVIMKSDCSVCREVVLDTAPQKVSSGMLFSLLRSTDKRLRIKALNRLAQYQDVGAVNLLRDTFNAEKDPEVRNRYGELFPQLVE